MDQSSSNYNDFNGNDEEDSIVIPRIPPDEDDLYSLLVVSRDATTEEITAAYRRLSRIYHPDKHLEHKDEAVNLFAKVKKAYEVLSDPRKRAIYNEIGLKGLESEGNELVIRYQTPQEIREEYERLNREREERMLERKTNPRGNMTVSLNCTEIFTPYLSKSDDDLEDYVTSGPYFEMSGFHCNQAIETPMTSDTTLVMSGAVSSDNGRGRGNISCGLRKTINNRSWGEVELGGSPNGIDFGLKGFSQFRQRFFTNIQAMVHNTGHGYRPALIIALGSQLDPHSVGTLTWRTGALNGLQTTYIKETPAYRLSLSLHLGFPHSFGLAQGTLKRDDYKLRATVKAGTFGAFVEYGIDKKFSQITQVGATMSVGIPVGVALRLKVSRSNQTYFFPIQLADEIIPSAIFYGSVAPFVVWLTIKKLFIEPYEQEKLAREREKKMLADKSRMAEKKAEAELAVILMRETYNRIRNEESTKKGVVIIKALYGRLASKGTPSSEPSPPLCLIDVTIPLQCLVREGKLILHDGAKTSLPGFYDPCPGDEKSLLVKYKFQDQLHEIIIRDTEPLRIPKPSHRMEVEED